MSYCKQRGKDKIIFATEEDHKTPSTVVLPEPEEPTGLILSNGEINWDCPCLGGMVTGPCGVEFREAFSCFHYSSADPKGSDCYETFKAMQDCMTEYPTVYNKKDDEDDDEDENEDNKDDKLDLAALEETPVKPSETSDVKSNVDSKMTEIDSYNKS